MYLELYTLCQTAPPKLYGQVDSSKTKVIVQARGLNITLFWMQLSR